MSAVHAGLSTTRHVAWRVCAALLFTWRVSRSALGPHPRGVLVDIRGRDGTLSLTCSACAFASERAPGHRRGFCACGRTRVCVCGVCGLRERCGAGPGWRTPTRVRALARGGNFAQGMAWCSWRVQCVSWYDSHGCACNLSRITGTRRACTGQHRKYYDAHTNDRRRRVARPQDARSATARYELEKVTVEERTVA